MRAYVVLCLALLLLTAQRGASQPALVLDPLQKVQNLEGHFSSLSYDELARQVKSEALPLLEQVRLTSGGSSALWFTFAVANPAPFAVKLVLAVGFPLYTMTVLDAATLKQVARTGAAVPLKDKIAALTPATFITFPSGKTEYILAVDADGNPFIPQFAIDTADHFFAEMNANITLFALFAGSMLTIGVFIFLFSIFMRDIHLAAVMLTAAAYVALEATIMGFPLLFEPPLSFRLGNGWLLWDALSMIGLTVLTRRIFNTKRNYPRLDRFFQLFLLLSFLIPPIFQLHALLFAGAYIAMESVAMAMFILIAIIELSKKNVMASAYLLSYLPVFVVSSLFFLQLGGIFPPHVPLNVVRSFSAVLWALMLAIGVIMLARQLRASHHTLRTTLAGLISAKQIERIVLQGGQLMRAPVKKYITVMLIDIVGYSRTIRGLSPIQGFTSLREILNEITVVVHKYEGIIDRSLGDGMLCFFGHGLLGVGAEDHEHRAFLSAVEIQQKSIMRIIKAGEMGHPALFPLRIAIHSATVCIGNLGEENRFEVALAGAGVFMAEKLEAVCEPHKIVVSSSAYEALPTMIRESQGFSAKYFPLTSRDNLQAGLEFDPFYDESELLRAAAKVYQKMAMFKQRHERFAVQRGLIRFDSVHGAMEVVNFSYGGFCLRSNTYLGRSTRFELMLTPLCLNEEIGFINPVTVVVLWGVIESQETYLFGVHIPHLNDRQKQLILEVMQEQQALREKGA